jgi:type II secretion system protein N
MAERTLRWEIFIYVGVFLAAFFLFALLRVPSAKLARIAAAYAESAGYRVDYADVSATLMPGFKLHNVRLFNLDEPKRPVLELASVSARATLLPLVLGRAGVNLAADIYGGKVEASIRNRGDTTWVRGRIADVNLENIDGIQRALQVPLKGEINAEFDLELLPTLIQHVGNISIAVSGLHLQPGQLMGAFSNPGVHFGNVHGAMLLENGRLLFDRFAGDGQDVKLIVDGSIALADPFTFSRLDLSLKLNLSARMEETFGYAFPLLGLNKNPEGQYLRRVSGTIGQPR